MVGLAFFGLQFPSYTLAEFNTEKYPTGRHYSELNESEWTSLDDNEIEYFKNQKFREEFGFSTEPDIIVQSLVNKSSPKYVSEYGVVLTVQENKDLKNRLYIQHTKIPAIRKYIEDELRDRFAGLYINQQKNEVIINFLDNVPSKEHINKILEIYGDDNIKFHTVKFSEDYLNELHQKVFTDWVSGKLDKASINEIKTNFVEQKVEIGLENLSDQVIDLLETLYNKDIISIYEINSSGDDSRTAPHTPLKGGLRINLAGSLCTGGFSAQSGSNYFYVSAGHCTGGNTGTSVTQGGVYIGNVTHNSLNQINRVDALAISINSNKAGSSVYISSTESQTLGNYERRNQDNIGDFACISGATTNEVSCGQIFNKNVSKTVNGIPVTNLRESSYVRAGGDSGGTVFSIEPYQNIYILKGIHQGYAGSIFKPVFTHVFDAYDSLNVTPIVK